MPTATEHVVVSPTFIVTLVDTCDYSEMADELLEIEVRSVDMESEDSLRASGFEGFLTTSALVASCCGEVPDQPRIYLILRPDREPARYLEKGVAGHFKGKDPTVAIEQLHANWVSRSIVLYIGKAAQRRGLRGRLDEYMRFGSGKPVAHWGGRFIWQLEDHADLVVCWRGEEEPRAVEAALIKQFIDEHGKRPFANLKG